MQSSFKSGSWNTKERAFWIVIRVESLILRTCECKALSERDSCVRLLEMRTEAMHGSISADCAVGLTYYSKNKILPCSAQLLIVIGKAFAMHVNARSSNHEPNQEADRDPKRLSERDSILCEQALCSVEKQKGAIALLALRRTFMNSVNAFLVIIQRYMHFMTFLFSFNIPYFCLLNELFFSSNPIIACICSTLAFYFSISK